MNDERKDVRLVVAPLPAPTVIAGAPESAPRLSGEFIRKALLGKSEIPPEAPLTVDDRGVRLEDATVEGTLDLSEMELRKAIVFARCTFQAPVILTDARLGSVTFQACRAPSIIADRADVAGDFRLAGVELYNPGKIAFGVAFGEIGGSLEFIDGCKADGAIVLLRVKIGREVNIVDAELRNPYPRAREDFGTPQGKVEDSVFAVALATIGGSIGLARCNLTGLVLITATRIGGSAVFVESSIRSGGAWSSLSLATSRIDGTLILTRTIAFEGTLNLRSAVAQGFGDDGSIWRDPETGRVRAGVDLELDQFRYEVFNDLPIVRTDASATTRLAWLKAQRQDYLSEDFRPQPFTQCAEVLRNMGDARGSRMILHERERLRLKAANVGFWEKLGGHVIGALAGYGYKNHYALYWALGVWLLGALVFGTANRLGEMRPASEHVLVEQEYKTTGRPPADYEPLNPAFYSADLLLPIIDIGQERYWLPRNGGERRPDVQSAFPHLASPFANALNWLFGGWLPKAYYYFEIAMGWLLVSIVIAGFSGLLGHAREE